MHRARKTSVLVRAAPDAKLDPQQLVQGDFECDRLEGNPYKNPLVFQKAEWVTNGIITDEDRRVMYDARPGPKRTAEGFPVSLAPFTMRLAQPRVSLHFKPEEVVVGIVTCGGLCPGLNDVIRSLTLTCLNSYHVKRVLGFRYGFWGLSSAGRDSAIELTGEQVRNIHRYGGTFLGTSRGPQKRREMVDTLLHYNINVLFTIGGDGTQKGAMTVAEECRARGLDIVVMGIPKTIDNDISFTHRTFGYETAVEQAVIAIRAAHAEASSHEYGVGIVKVMGRDSGFIAAQSTVSSAQANICLIPENQIKKEVVLALIQKRFETSKYCIIVVAEGFGQNWVAGSGGTDASGNKKLIDIGCLMRDEVTKWLAKDPRYSISTVKYIDPSYMIRACVPSASDASFCLNLASLAVHEAMAGTTNAIVTSWHENFIVLPIRLVTALRKMVSLQGTLWRQVRELTVDLDEDTPARMRREAAAELRCLAARREAIKRGLSKL